jgi:hypothetical protein
MSPSAATLPPQLHDEEIEDTCDLCWSRNDRCCRSSSRQNEGVIFPDLLQLLFAIDFVPFQLTPQPPDQQGVTSVVVVSHKVQQQLSTAPPMDDTAAALPLKDVSNRLRSRTVDTEDTTTRDITSEKAKPLLAVIAATKVNAADASSCNSLHCDTKGVVVVSTPQQQQAPTLSTLTTMTPRTAAIQKKIISRNWASAIKKAVKTRKQAREGAHQQKLRTPNGRQPHHRHPFGQGNSEAAGVLSALDENSHAPTPRRKGHKAQPSAETATTNAASQQQQSNEIVEPKGAVTADWIKGQIECMKQQQVHLAAVQAQSEQEQQRAVQSQERIQAIRTQVVQLHKALLGCLHQLEDEMKVVAVVHDEDENVTPSNGELDVVRCAQRVMESCQRLLLEHHDVVLVKPMSDGATSSCLSDDGSGENEVATGGTNNRERALTTMTTRSTSSSTTSTHSLSSSSSIDFDFDLSNHSARGAGRDDASYKAKNSRLRVDTQPSAVSPTTSFMRVADLDGLRSSTSSIQSLASPSSNVEDFFFIDHDVPLVMEQLFSYGYSVVTDESERFEPTRDTLRLLQNYNKAKKLTLPKQRITTPSTAEPECCWSVGPWQVVEASDVLVWTGGVPHKGFGHDWPVVKARARVRAPPRAVLDVLLDSSQVKTYNKMSVGRDDVLILQEGVETRKESSPYGLAGDVRIMRSLNKPRLLPKTIEVLSLWYTKQLEHVPPGTFMTVSRSVWEDDSGLHKSCRNDTLRSEMLLGVTLLRPVPAVGTTLYHCEITTITHVFSPGVPEYMAKRATPASAANLLRDIQALFLAGKRN